MTDSTKEKGMAGEIPVYCAFDEILPIAELRPNPKNPNQHPKEQIELLAKIIQAQGWRMPVTVSTLSGLVVRGHGRLIAAKYAGLSEVPVDFQHYCSEDAELADLLADNKIAELSDIDDGMLAEIFKSVDFGELDTNLTGFTTEEIEKISEAFEYLDAKPDDFDCDFTLSNTEQPIYKQLTVHFNVIQYEKIVQILEWIKANYAGNIRDEGNDSTNGNAIYTVVMEWAEQKKLL